MSTAQAWPALPLERWRDTYATVHMWSQIIGKIRLAHAAPENHWWHVAMYVTPRGLTTGTIPYGSRAFSIQLDVHDHALRINVSDGQGEAFDLSGLSVAEFYSSTMGALQSLDLETTIWTVPVEVEDRTPFEHDTKHASYDPDAIVRFWQILLQSERVMRAFRGDFLGKSSPVHFFWGSFDLAVTRFSGRRAPPHPGGPNVARSVMIEAYSHELSSAGFWPGGGPVSEPMYYAYAYPEPAGYRTAMLEVPGAFYSDEMGEFLLPYEAVRTSADPDGLLRMFLEETYSAAANRGGWQRELLDRPTAGHAV